MARQNYLNNKDLLAEIHKSKTSFSSFTQPEYNQYDIIVNDVNDINGIYSTTNDDNGNTVVVTVIEQAKKNKAKRLSTQAYDAYRAEGVKIKQAECEVLPESITTSELIFRVMTYDHIPEEPGRKKNPKSIADTKIKLNFPPFKHYKFNDQNEIELVGKSHWKGDLDTGSFNKTHGQITDKLARMYIKLCERYATRGNVRGYTYNDEMQGQAILQLTQIGLQFDESKSDNPFAYFTAAVTNSFVRIINIEKRNQVIRDDLLEMNGMNPSFTRTNDNEYAVELKRHVDDDED